MKSKQPVENESKHLCLLWLQICFMQGNDKTGFNSYFVTLPFPVLTSHS